MNCSVRVFSMTWDILIVGVLAIGTLLAEGMGFMEVTIIVTFCFGIFQEALKGCKKMSALILTCTTKCVLAGVVAYQTYATECESCPEDKAKILVGSFLWASVVLSVALNILGAVSTYKSSGSLNTSPIAA